MKRQLVYIALIASLLGVSACTSEKVSVLKSPCVGTDDSPCGPKRFVNQLPA